MTPAQQEYIITNDMLVTWRSGCIRWSDQNPDSSCYGCEFYGNGARKNCCEFDDDAMQKIFQSRPHTPAPEGCSPTCQTCLSEMATFCSDCDRVSSKVSTIRNHDAAIRAEEWEKVQKK